MNKDEFRTLDVAGRLPTPKGVAHKVLRLLKSETASAQEIARAIASDPALADRVISAANAISIRGPRPVASALEALARVGTAGTCRLALGFSVLSANKSGRCADFDYRQFWVRSLLLGITMQTLAARTKIVAPEEAFTIGLLAEIGRLALATLHPDSYGAALARAQAQGCDRAGCIAVERAAFATDNVELSEMLLAEWGFPTPLIEAVGSYGRGPLDPLAPDARRHAFAESLRLADLLVMTALEPAERDRHQSDILAIIAFLELDPDDLRSLDEEVAATWPAWARLLDLDRKDIARFELNPVDAVAVNDSTDDADAPPRPAVTTLRHAMDQLEIEWQVAHRAHAPLACLMIDIDHFKRINDTYGHAAGDKAIRQLAAALGDAARAADTVCRVGGEEFLVICRNTDRDAARLRAERLRAAVENNRSRGDDPNHPPVTISIGVAVTGEPGVVDTRTLLEHADQALHRAKRDGRNRVACAA